MDHKTLEALQGSIKKWKGILSGELEDDGPDNCPLCQLFFNNPSCGGCPVKESTGKPSCRSTPYDSVILAEHAHGTSDYRYIVEAQKEVDFLKSLLPAVEVIRDGK